MSKILRGTQGLSSAKARSVAAKLGFPASEIEGFVQLAEAAWASPKVRAEAARQARADAPFVERELEIFEMMAHWQHFAILELLQIRPNLTGDPEHLATLLGISADRLSDSLGRLERLGFLVRQRNQLKVSKDGSKFGDRIPSRAIREYHVGLLHLAMDALLNQSFEERDVSNVILRMSPRTFALVRKKIRSFRDSVARLCDADRDANQVYSLNLQLFGLTRRLDS